MADKGIVHFLFFIAVILIYFLYDQSQYIDKIFKTAEEMQKTLQKQEDIIATQQLYIQLLEQALTSPSSPSPQHGPNSYRQPL